MWSSSCVSVSKTTSNSEITNSYLIAYLSGLSFGIEYNVLKKEGDLSSGIENTELTKTLGLSPGIV